MRTALAISAMLSSLLLCGCLHKQATSTHQAIDFVEAGKDVAWLGGSVDLYVTKRDGDSIQGIRLVTKDPHGKETTITADKGTVSEGSDAYSVRITLYDGKSESGKMHTSFQKFTVELFK
jgi:hypothetical protein